MPYFAVIAAIVASSASVPLEIGLLALYNVAFVLPLLTILVVLLVAGERADRWLEKAGLPATPVASGARKPSSSPPVCITDSPVSATAPFIASLEIAGGEDAVQLLDDLEPAER